MSGGKMAEDGLDKVKITVQSVTGYCQAGHCIGQEIIVDNITLSAYLCPHALHTLWPYVQVLQYGGKFPWGDKDGIAIACPDPDNLVRFNLRRVKEKAE
jgi:uncharacterized repeat protein (TIGR04076 family)